jgi:uncharacterized protein (TIGR00369 family)
MDVEPERVARVPSNRLLGLVVREQWDGGATVTMAPRPELAQEYGVVHGGFLAALADTAAVYALLPKVATGERMTSIEFKVNFLAPADPAGGELVAMVDVHQQPPAAGASSSAGAAKSAARHVLTGLFTYAVIPAREG